MNSAASSCCSRREGSAVKAADARAPGALADPTPVNRADDTPVNAQIYEQTAQSRGWITATGCERSATLIVRGMTCAACAWSIEKRLKALNGVEEATVSYAAHTVNVRWRAGEVQFKQFIDALRELGYEALPCDPELKQNVIADERRDLLRRFGVSLAFGMQVMTLTVAMYIGVDNGMDRWTQSLMQLCSLVLTLPILFYGAKPFYASAWRSAYSYQPNMDLAVSLAISLAFAASAWASLSQTGDVYFESVVMFVVLLLGTRYLETSIRLRANQHIEALATAAPRLARRIRDGHVEDIAAYLLAVGDEIIVAPGDAFAADGEIIEGASSVDESIVTGESMPRLRRPGERVLAGAINVDTPLRVRVSHSGDDTLLSDLHRLVDRVQSSKPHISQIADRISGWFVAAVIVLALTTAALWYAIDASRWLPITIAVLAVACPCALSLATPAAMASALSRFVKLGMLPTNGDAIEKLAGVGVVLFDKTGTLTTGKASLEHVTTHSEIDRETCLGLAASMEQHSRHPIGRALIAANGDAPLHCVNTLRHESGGGLAGNINGAAYYLGSSKFVAKHTGVTIPPETDYHGSLVHLCDADALLCTFFVQDSIRHEAASVVTKLKQRGITTALVSGDRSAAVAHVGAQLGIDRIHADCLPEEKYAIICGLQRRGAKVAMVGDGVNDSPSLAAADVSFAIGNASELATKSADIVLIQENLDLIPQAIDMAKRTRAIVKQNLLWAIGYNVLSIPAAALGWIPPWLAALGMSLSSLVVVSNALRLQRQARRRDRKALITGFPTPSSPQPSRSGS